MDIKQILKEKIEALFDERKPLVEEFDQYHTYVKYPDITKLNGEIQAYTDCLTLIEQFERPMKVITILATSVLDSNCDICPHCKGVLNKWLNDFQRDKTPCCPFCGGNLDWGEGEKK